jgi:sigma-B regulation protein RsbU (phosphoserine phosphatase)
VSSAGRLRPVLANPGRPAPLVDMPVYTPLGIKRPAAPDAAPLCPLRAGALLLRYTDGLVERRDQIIDVGISVTPSEQASAWTLRD